MHYYRAFGLRFASDMGMRELLLADAGEVDVYIKAGPVPYALSDDRPPVKYFEGEANKLLLNIDAVGRFLIQNGNEITYSRDANADDDNLRLFLLGSCMGALLQQRGLVVLHGNAITFNDTDCSIYVGVSGAGKSTQAAYAWKQGARILADDVCAIYFNEAGQPWVIPSYPQIKIWQNTADLLGINTKDLPKVRPQDDKYALRIEPKFCHEALPLSQVFEIDVNCQEPVELVGVLKFKRLLEHSYRPYFLSAMGLSPSYVKRLGSVAQKVNMTCIGRAILNR